MRISIKVSYSKSGNSLKGDLNPDSSYRYFCCFLYQSNGTTLKYLISVYISN